MEREKITEELMNCFREDRMVPLDLLLLAKRNGIHTTEVAALKKYIQEVELDPKQQDAEAE